MTLLWTCLTLGTAMTTSFMVGTLVPIYAASLGMSPVAIGALVSLVFVAPLMLAIPVGRRVDVTGVRPHLVVGTSMLVILPLLVAARPDAWALAVLQVGTGTAQVLLMISGQAGVAAIGGGAHRLRNLGWYSTAVASAQLVGPVLAGALADAWGFRGAFAASTVLALIALGMLPFLRSVLPTPAAAPPLRAAMAQLWARPSARIGMVASSVVLMTLVVNQAFLPVLLTDAGISATAIGALFSLVAFTSLLVRPFVSRIVGTLGGAPAAIVRVTLLVAAGALMTGLLPVPWMLVAVAVALGAGSGVSQPTSMELVLEGTDTDRRGAALGLRITVNRVAQMLGPLLLGFAAQALGTQAAFVGAGVAAAVAVVLVRWHGARS